MPQETVLIVDDDQDHQKTLSKRAQRAGFKTQVAGNLPDALEILEKGEIKFMVLDAGFPMAETALSATIQRQIIQILPGADSTGDLLVRLIQARNLKMPAIIFTNSDFRIAAKVIGETIGGSATVFCSDVKNDTNAWDNFILACKNASTQGT